MTWEDSYVPMRGGKNDINRERKSITFMVILLIDSLNVLAFIDAPYFLSILKDPVSVFSHER